MEEETSQNKEEKAPKIKLPGKENERGWAVFCYGAEMWNKIVSVRLAEAASSSDDEMDPSTREVDVTVGNRAGHAPLVSTVDRMKPSTCVRVFEHHVGWVHSLAGLALPEMGPWVYTLLARLEKPLHPDVTSALRALVRACREQRVLAIEMEDEKAINALTLFICLGANYFGQQDLADTAKIFDDE